jgi:cytochrome c553
MAQAFAVAMIAGIAALAANHASAAEASFERGERKAAQCVACHGIAGETDQPMFPDLGGQNEGYLAQQLYDFRSGERYHPIMSPIAQNLSDQDIADLAVYYNRVLDGAAGDDNSD